MITNRLGECYTASHPALEYLQTTVTAFYLHKLHMKKTTVASLLLILSAYSSTAFAQHAALTAADYARAEKMLGYNTSPLVDRAVGSPTFLPDGRLWYQTVTPTGTEFVLINPADGSRNVGESLEK